MSGRPRAADRGCARDVEGLEPGLFDLHGGQGIEGAGNGDWAGRQQSAQSSRLVLALRHVAFRLRHALLPLPGREQRHEGGDVPFSFQLPDTVDQPVHLWASQSARR